jgi:hypothetical protein
MKDVIAIFIPYPNIQKLNIPSFISEDFDHDVIGEFFSKECPRVRALSRS